MQTRTAAKKKPMMKVLLQFRPSGEYWEVGETDDYGKAMDLAIASHRIHEGWNLAITEVRSQS
jgi:hypothetical protein